jgi:hypothetical protein
MMGSYECSRLLRACIQDRRAAADARLTAVADARKRSDSFSNEIGGRSHIHLRRRWRQGGLAHWSIRRSRLTMMALWKASSIRTSEGFKSSATISPMRLSV